jgi:plasmid stabilization system protein ParE
MLKVYLSDLAQVQLDLLFDYLESEWSIAIKNKFWTKMLNSFNQISNYPNSCPKSFKYPDLHKCVVTKQTSFLYRVKENEIEIIYIKDNRQDIEELSRQLLHRS